ncbi:MAG: glucose-6-phosphate isomerase [Ignavibacteria bacterium]|nr:MAG: glucose-6-phosphate isomerase [Ignavibacteria bacterium]
MSNDLRIEAANCTDALSPAELDAARVRIIAAQHTLQQRTGAGNEFLGWMDLPDSALLEMADIRSAAEEVRAHSDVLVVVGIGGSYLGARAVIESLSDPFDHGGLEVVYAGHHIDGGYLTSLMKHLAEKRVSLCVISKSGTTTEPALAFRILRQWMEERYGKAETARRIIAITDARKGALRKVADEEGYRSFIIPDDVGGRFSVFTPVGMLPIAAAGVDAEGLLEGARTMREVLQGTDPELNPVLQYSMYRDAFYRAGRGIEVLASFHPRLHYVTEWWKQLFGESEGKDGKGIFPAAVSNTTDLHSMGQYIQDGMRTLFETFLTIDELDDRTVVPSASDDTDGLNYLAGRAFSEVNRSAMLGTALAHRTGGTPNLAIHLRDGSARSIGALLYFFETAVALNGYALGVNPFDQPGVEEYKRNMFALLGKPGFEQLREELLKKLSAE